MSEENDLNHLNAMGKTPSGLFIVTAKSGEKQAAFLGSFVQQASFDPLVFSVAVHPDRYPYTLMNESKKFGLTIIPEGDKTLLKTFAKGHGPDEDLIATVSHELVEDVPLLKDGLGGCVCEIVHEAKPGDHTIVFGKVIAGSYYQPEAKPWVHTRKSALSY